MAYNTRPSAPDRLCTDLLQRLQIAILEHVTGSEFRIIGHPPSWLFTLYPDARDTLQLSVGVHTPVLQNDGDVVPRPLHIHQFCGELVLGALVSAIVFMLLKHLVAGSLEESGLLVIGCRAVLDQQQAAGTVSQRHGMKVPGLLSLGLLAPKPRVRDVVAVGLPCIGCIGQEILKHRCASIDGQLQIVSGVGVEGEQPGRRVPDDAEICTGDVFEDGKLEPLQQIRAE